MAPPSPNDSLKDEIRAVLAKVGESLAGKASRSRLTLLRCGNMEQMQKAARLLPKAFPRIQWVVVQAHDTPVVKLVRDAVLAAEQGSVVILYGLPGEDVSREISLEAAQLLEVAVQKTRIVQLPVLLMIFPASVKVLAKSAPTLWKRKGGYHAWPTVVPLPDQPAPPPEPVEAVAPEEVPEIAMDAEGKPDSEETRKVLESLEGDVAAAYLVKVSRTHMAAGDSEQARLFLLRAVQIFSQSANMAGMAEAYHLLGVGAQVRGDYDTALEWFDQAIDSLRVVDDKVNLSEAISQKGYVYYLRGQYEHAVKAFNEALEVDQALGMKDRISAGYRKIAMVLELGKNFKSAEELYQKSLELEQQRGSNPGIARVYHHLGRVREEQGDLDKALELYQQSLDLNTQGADKSGMATSHHQLGNLCLKKGDFEGAVQNYNLALEFEKDLGDRQSMARTSAQLGLAFRELGQVEQSLHSLVRAYQILQKLRSPVAAEVLSKVEELQELVSAEVFNRILREAAVTTGV